jgi:hypothetical protein
LKISNFLAEVLAAEQAGNVSEMERLCRELFGFAFQGNAWAFMIIFELKEKGAISMDTMTMATIETAQDEICKRLDRMLKILVKIDKKLEVTDEKK